MSREHLTIEYADDKIKELQPFTSAKRLAGDQLDEAEKFFIEFIEIMSLNNISSSGCYLFTQVILKNINQLNEFPKIKEMLKYAKIYLEIMKPEPSVYETRGILTI